MEHHRSLSRDEWFPVRKRHLSKAKESQHHVFRGAAGSMGATAPGCLLACRGAGADHA